jgi:hypothetical protein
MQTLSAAECESPFAVWVGGGEARRGGGEGRMYWVRESTQGRLQRTVSEGQESGSLWNQGSRDG